VSTVVASRGTAEDGYSPPTGRVLPTGLDAQRAPSAPIDTVTSPRPRAHPSSGRLRQGLVVGAAMVDQVLSSGPQLLLTILIAHVATAEVFGAASIVLIVQGLVLGSQRAFIGDVVLLRCRRAGVDHADEVRTGLLLATGLGLAVAGVLLAVATVAIDEMRPLLLLLALVTPFTFAQDLLRSFAFGRRRVMDAVVLDGIWMGAFVAVSAALFLAGEASASSLILAWGSGAAASLLYGCVGLRSGTGRAAVRSWMRDDGRRALSFLADYIVHTGVTLMSFLALGFFMPLAEYGALRLARVTMSPPGNVLAGVRSLLLGRLGESSRNRAATRRLRATASPSLAGFVLAYGLVVLAMPESVGERLFGDTWAGARPLVLAVALAEALRFAALPSMDIVRVFGTARELLGAQAVSSAASVAAILIGGIFWGASGVVWATAAVMTMLVGLWWWQSTNVTSSDRA
jgi:O-antigen/teichoic acid export membrane protein